MGREMRSIQVAFTVDKPEHIYERTGRMLYADDVVAEVQEIVDEAVQHWYEHYGHLLLACEPT